MYVLVEGLSVLTTAKCGKNLVASDFSESPACLFQYTFQYSLHLLEPLQESFSDTFPDSAIDAMPLSSCLTMRPFLLSKGWQSYSYHQQT